MTKVFISQPMANKTEQEILEERANIFQYAKERFPDAELIDSYFDDYKPSTGSIGLKYLAKSLELLADADVAYFAPGWDDARGCRIENECAIEYGIEVHEIHYFMLFKKFRKKHEPYNLREEVAAWTAKHLGEEHVDEMLDKYDKINSGIPIGGFAETAAFIDLIRTIKAEKKHV